MRKTQKKPLPANVFDYLKMFNHVVLVDEELDAQLPATDLS
jgi:hypothetical protein